MEIIWKPRRENGSNGDGYRNRAAVKYAINYATRNVNNNFNQAPYAIGGIGVCMDNPEMMCRQFHKVQSVYNKDKYGVHVLHEIVSFFQGETIDQNGVDRIAEIAYKFGAIYYLAGFQVVYAVHMNTDHPHIHYVVNAVNFMDGHKFNRKLPDLEHRREYLARVRGECLNKRPLMTWLDDIGWKPEYYAELNHTCVHSGFVEGR